MKKYFFLLSAIIILSCDKDKALSNNPYLQNVSFSYLINLNLPAYSQLIYTGNSVLIANAGAGIKGIMVIKTGVGNTGNDYKAYEASCPNHAPSDCSLMTLSGSVSSCPCDALEYNLYSGLGGGQYPLKQYRVEVSGANLRVYN